LRKEGAAPSAPVRLRAGGVTVALRVTPKASRESIDGIEARGDGVARLRVRVRALPDKGKANKAVIALLAKAWDLPPRALSIVSGETARDKVLLIEGAGAAIAATLTSWLEARS
jgi:uncharacterized protein